jgi:hypothetical protein
LSDVIGSIDVAVGNRPTATTLPQSALNSVVTVSVPTDAAPRRCATLVRGFDSCRWRGVVLTEDELPSILVVGSLAEADAVVFLVVVDAVLLPRHG